MKQNERLSMWALAAALLCESLYDGMYASGTVSAKAFLLFGVVDLAVVEGALYFLNRMWEGRRRIQEALCAASAAVAMLHTGVQALRLCGNFFAGTALWLAAMLPALFWAGRAHSGGFAGVGWALCVVLVLTGGFLIAGLWSQMRWTRLSFAVEGTPLTAIRQLRFYPEYLLACTEKNRKCAFAFPGLDFAVRFLLVVMLELVFGSLATQLTTGELVRAWGLGMFSRFDALMLMVWFLLAFFRVVLMASVLWKFAEMKKGEVNP